MSADQKQKDFSKQMIFELIKKIIIRENLYPNNDSYTDLNWIKFYVKELAHDCKCNEEKQEKKE